MATLKLKTPPRPQTGKSAPQRTPVRGVGAGVNKRPTLAQAQVQRTESEARYQDQLRQRFGERPPAGFTRRDAPQTARPAPRPDRAPRPQPQRARPDTPERDARYDDQLRQRFGGTPPPEFTRRSESRGNPRTDARTAPRSDPRTAPRFDPRPDQRTAPRFDPRADPRAAPRFDPRADPRTAPRFDPRADPRTAPRFDPRADPRTAPRSDPRSAPRFDQRAPRSEQRPEPRPERSAPPQPRHRYDAREDREPAEHAPGSMRLSKRMSELGIASRREADEWIAAGLVRVDDQIVKELGSRVVPGQRITVDAKARYQQAQRVTVLVNKPVGFVSGQAEDGYEPAVVLVTPTNQWHEDRSGTRFLREHLRSLVPAGRLDIDSVGLLVLTQDGRVAKQLVGEDSEIEKEYLVRVATANGQRLPDASLALLCHGLELDGEALRPALVEWVNDDQLRFVLQQGKKRQIRRMCEAVGMQVLGLKRVRIGKVMLGDLPPGCWRYLRMDESFV
jgi:23S rRNA pseudouridine2604 synthase